MSGKEEQVKQKLVVLVQYSLAQVVLVQFPLDGGGESVFVGQYSMSMFGVLGEFDVFSKRASSK